MEQFGACLNELKNTACCHFLPVSKHAAKLKTGSAGSCDQLARVPLVQLWRKSRPSSRSNLWAASSQPVFMCPFPRFYLTFDFHAGLRFTPLCRPLTTDWTRKSHFFRPVWPFSSKNRVKASLALLYTGENLNGQPRWINILPVFTTFLAAVYPSALLEK